MQCVRLGLRQGPDGRRGRLWSVASGSNRERSLARRPSATAVALAAGGLLLRREFSLPAGRREARPSFVHRDLGLDGTDGNREWYARNRLEARFEHGHNLREIYRTEDFAREPDLAPVRNGQRFVPPGWSANCGQRRPAPGSCSTPLGSTSRWRRRPAWPRDTSSAGASPSRARLSA